MKNRKITDYANLYQMASRQFVMARRLSPRRAANAAGILQEYMTKKTVLKHKPLLLKVEPSTFCNLRCPPCHPDGNNKGGIMEMMTFKTVMDNMPLEYFLKSSMYMFGEPLMNRNIHQMIRRMTDRGLPTSISTNFHAFNARTADEMIDSGLTWILICIDGATQSSYEKYRVGGNLQKVLDNLKLLIEKKKETGSKYPIVEIQCVIFEHNRDEIEDIRQMCLALGVDRFTAKEDVYTQLDMSSDKKELVNPPKRPCYFLYGSFMVDYDGVVTPCCLGRYDFGNLHESSFEEIWNNYRFVAAREWFASGFTSRIDDLNLPCYTCPLFM
ncbi:MAG: radical SAM protein [Thermoleophilia bacterium]